MGSPGERVRHRVGQSFPMTVTLPDQERVFVAAWIVRWVRGEDNGVETLVVNGAALHQVARFINQQSVNELTQWLGGSYGLTTPERDCLHRTIPRRFSCNPPDFPDPDRPFSGLGCRLHCPA